MFMVPRRFSGSDREKAIPGSACVSRAVFGVPPNTIRPASSLNAAKPKSIFADGSVQQVSTATFNQKWLRNATPTTDWPAGHVPAAPSIRLVFP
jgi:hypothetical protein